MPGTYSQLLLHVVFSTKRRTPCIVPAVSDRLYSYLGGIARGEGCTLLACGGIEDHIHLYFRVRPDRSLSDVMRTLKSQSSLWLHG